MQWCKLVEENHGQIGDAPQMVFVKAVVVDEVIGMMRKYIK